MAMGASFLVESKAVNDYETRFKQISQDYADYLAVFELGHKQYPDRAYMPHCDQLVLHTNGVCVHCDHYPDLQEARRSLRIAFTGEAPSIFQRPCPATLLRSTESIHAWHGNAPMTGEQLQTYLDEQARILEGIFPDIKRERQEHE